MSTKKPHVSAKPPLYKIVMLGDSGVGKTSLVHRLVSPDAPISTSLPATMGIEFDTKLIETTGGPVKAQLWDTAGQERFSKVLLPTYFRKAKGCVLVYDLSNPTSLTSLETKWLKECTSIKGIIVGNKCDLGTFSPTPGEELAAKNGMKHFIVSAFEGTSVGRAFQSLVEKVHVEEDGEGEEDKDVIKLGERREVKKESGCC
ncbi:hypothetical protein TrLO_g3351 [Triparma laevis f. longispina]|uniref:Uncharacterized protein n=1 Tax=Triparma laevis f. longispina TaxID=1714387 RepID=A0A9W7FNJ8_9STRA|nr:hypothetical protein TrLO_g3351 [Triparma laevis f. longispina]